MRQLRNNRRGQIFVVSVIIAVTAALIAAAIILHSLYKETNPDQYLGRYQSAIVDSMNDADKMLLYVDEAAKMSVTKAFDEYLYGNPNPLTNVEGGDAERKYCGSYVDRLWNTLGDNCYPDYKSADFELNKLIDKHLSELTKNPKPSKDYPKIEQYFDSLIRPDINYKYVYLPKMEGTTIVFTTQDKYTVNVFKNRKTAMDENVQEYLQSKAAYSGSLIWPLEKESYIVSCFGYRGDFSTKNGIPVSPYHPGLDIPAEKGTPVLAAASGVIKEKSSPWGKLVIDHGNGLRTAYTHMDSFAKESDGSGKELGVDSVITQKQVIGYVGGKNGRGTVPYGNHLHFEVISTNVDPNTMFDGIGAVLIKPGKNYVNPLCFMDMTKADGTQRELTFKLVDEQDYSCSSICNLDGNICTCNDKSSDSCANPATDAANSAPYKFCSVYQGVVSKDAACLKSAKTDWKIEEITLSRTELTSDDTLKISMIIENSGDTCVTMQPELSIVPNSANSRLEIMNPTIEKVNVNPKTDSILLTTVELACTFTTDKDAFMKAINEKKCILYAPVDGTEREYTITAAMTDYNNEKKFYSKELKFTVKKGAGSGAINNNNNNNNANSQQILVKEYDDVKSKISSLQLRALYPGESILIAVGTIPQKMYLVKGTPNGGVSIEKTYYVSLAQKGFGSEALSNKTPIGLHVINEKNGGDVPKDTILIGGGTIPKGIAKIYTDNTNIAADVITSRVLRLDGMESSNKNSYDRGIYIHGTAEEGLIGTPQSHGCIRMRNDDVIELFNSVDSGTYVYIVESLSGQTASQSTTSTNTVNGNSFQTTVDPMSQLSNSDKAKLKKTEDNLNALGIRDYIAEIAQKEGVDEKLVLGLITTESVGNKDVTSGTGAYGLFQVILSIHKKRIIDECQSIENFKTDAKCQVRVGIGIMKAYHKQFGTKGIDFKCSCDGNKGTNNCHSMDERYVDWDAAIRAYNCADCTSDECKLWADYNFVDTVMKYASGWGYIGTTDRQIKDEMYAGILGTYDVNPRFNALLNFDISLLDILKIFANNTIKTCGVEGVDRAQCIQDGVVAFNNNLPQQYKDTGITLKTTCDTDNAVYVNRFVEDVNDCMSSSDDMCQCVFNNSNPYAEVESVDSVEGSTKVSYYANPNSNEMVNAYFDYSIQTDAQQYWSSKTVLLNSITLFKNDTKLLINHPGGKNCDTAKSAYRFCLNTRYQYNVYDDRAKSMKTKDVRIPFAIMVRDNIAPKPVSGLESTPMLHSKNSLVLKWDAGVEGDIVRYNIYLSDTESEFSQPTVNLKNVITQKSANARKKEYLEYNTVDLDNPTCILTEDLSEGTKYCTFNYTVVDKDNNAISTELEKERLYYITSLKKFVYILSGDDIINDLVTGTDKFIVVTAVDIDGNEIDNIETKQKIVSGANLITVIPEDKLEPGFVDIISQNMNIGRSKVILSFENMGIYIDGTPIVDTTNLNYNIYASQGTCDATQLTDVSKSSQLQSTINEDIDITLTQPSGGMPIEYCVYVLTSINNNEFMKGFAINTIDIQSGMPIP